jgi:iron complex outermembrane receptor protein
LQNKQTLSWVVLGAVLSAAPAAAEVQLGTVEVEAEREPAPAADPSIPFVTVVDARAPSARVSSVADLIERQPGVQIRARGGLGSFSSVSLRGSDANEVAVFIDGVPLNRGSSGVIDLALVPVDGLERVEIYRGVAPIEFGAEAVGGVINLVTRKGGRQRQIRRRPESTTATGAAG